MLNSNVSNSIIIRVNLSDKDDALTEVLTCVNQLNGYIGAIDMISADDGTTTRDITINTQNTDHADQIVSELEKLAGVDVHHVSDRTFLLHLGGKIEVKSKIKITNRDDLSMAYTPGVARVCMDIHAKPENAFNLTIRKNTVAIVSDGSAVLGLGNIGPIAALPVMEGKAMLFKEFGNVDAFPICLDTQDIEEIIETVKRVAINFGGINLEDISAPRCFEIEDRLKNELDIPVFHDDQHGTAAVMTAAFINALKIVDKKASDVKVIVNGVGAAGTACAKMLLQLGVTNIIGCDRKGVINRNSGDLNPAKQALAEITNPHNESGSVFDALQGADVFVGLSAPNILTVEHLKTMNKDAIIFAMANPTPEIMPEVARGHVAIMATGRSDYPNQINNLLAFPGIFRGALDCQAKDITPNMQLAAAYAIADIIEDKNLTADYIVPSVFNKKVCESVARAVLAAAKEDGVART